MKKLFFFAVLTVVFSKNFVNAQNYAKQDEKTNLYGIVNDNGDYVIKPVYKEVEFSFGNKPGLSYVIDTKDKYGFINEAGKLVVPCKYDKVDAFENGYAVARNKVGQYDYMYGLIDSVGKEVIPLKYGHFEYYPADKVIVVGASNTSDVGVVDLSGKIIIPAQYEFWSKRISKGLWPVGKNDICGVVNMKNEVVVPFTFAMIESYSDELGIAPARQDKAGKFGFIDRLGKTVIPFMYDNAWPSSNYLAVKKDGKWGVVDASNKIILPFEFIDISTINKSSVWVTKNEKEGSFEIDLNTKQKITK